MSDLVSALKAAFTRSKEGYTVSELCALAKLPETQCGALKIRAFLKGEIAAGRIKPGTGWRVAIDGRLRPSPIYVPIIKNK